MLRFFSRGALGGQIVDTYKRELANVIYGYKAEDEDKYEDAVWLVGQFNYRKMFHLSWEQFKKEPYSLYILNLAINKIQQQREESKMNKKKN